MKYLALDRNAWNHESKYVCHKPTGNSVRPKDIGKSGTLFYVNSTRLTYTLVNKK